MRREKISGIYKIQSKIKPESFYIGSSCDIYSRFGQHKRSVNYTSRRSIKLCNHISKYGFEDMELIVLERCENKREILLEREQYFIDTLVPTLNILMIAGSPLGHCYKDNIERINKLKIAGFKKRGEKRSEESKKKMSIAHIGCIAWNKGKKLNYDVWHKGRTGVFSEDTLKCMSISHIGNKQSIETINKRILKLIKPIIQYDKYGNFIREWDSIISAKTEMGFSSSHISGCCNGKRKTSNGFIWKFKEDNISKVYSNSKNPFKN